MIAAYFALATRVGVTITDPGQPLERLVPELARATGRRLVVDASLAGDVVALQVRDVDADELLRKVAFAVDAEWRQEGTSWLLVRSLRNREERKRREDAAILAQLRAIWAKTESGWVARPEWTQSSAEALAADVLKLRRAWDETRSFNATEQLQRDIARRSPNGYIFRDLVHLLGPKAFTELRPTKRIIYSTLPSAMQRPFSAETQPAITRSLEAIHAWERVAAREHLNQPFRDSSGGTVSFGLFGNREDRPPRDPIAGFRLTAQELDIGGPILLALEGFTSSGDLIFEETMQLIGPLRGASLDPDWLIRPDRAGPEYDLNRALDPVRFEPLADAIGSRLCAIAERRHVNFVGALCDQMVSGGFRVAARANLDDVVRNRYPDAFDVQHVDGWMIVRPRYPREAEQTRAPRAVIKKWLERRRASSIMTLAEEAAFALKLPISPENNLPDALRRLVEKAPVEWGGNGREALRLYGSLSEDLRKRMTTPDGVSIADLPAAARQALDVIVYGRKDPQIERKWVTTSEDGAVTYHSSFLDRTIFGDATFTFPTGLPPQGRIRMTLNEQSVIVPERADGGQIVAELVGSAADLARLANSRPERYDFNRLRAASKVDVRFIVDFGAGLSITRSLQGLTTPTGGEMSISQLPEDFRTAYETYLSRLRANSQFQRNGSKGAPKP